MRLRYSEKALRQVAGAPPQDCGTHPGTTYARVPAHLRDEVPFTWACAECLKEKQAEYEARRRAWRERRLEAEAAVRAERRTMRKQAARVREQLAEVVERASAALADAERERAAAARARKRAEAAVAEAVNAVARAERDLLAARQNLSRQKRRLADARAAAAVDDPTPQLAERLCSESDAVEEALGQFSAAADWLLRRDRKALMGKGGGRATVKAATKLISTLRAWPSEPSPTLK